MYLSYANKIKRSFTDQAPKLLGTLVTVFIAYMAMSLLAIAFLKEMGKPLSDILPPEAAATAQNFIIGILTFFTSLAQFFVWLVAVSILYYLFRFFNSSIFPIKYKNFLKIWGQLLPIKAITYCLLVIALAILTNQGLTKGLSIEQAELITEGAGFISSIVYVASISYFFFQQIKTGLASILAVLLFPYLLISGSLLASKVFVLFS